MTYVYLLRSLAKPDKTYIGLTTDVNRRIGEHNSSTRGYTKKFQPWELVGYVALVEAETATKLEQYLKSGSGHAFARKHLWALPADQHVD